MKYPGLCYRDNLHDTLQALGAERRKADEALAAIRADRLDTRQLLS